MDPSVVDGNLDDITTTGRSDRRNSQVSFKEIVELSDEDGTISYEILNNICDKISSINTSKIVATSPPGRTI